MKKKQCLTSLFRGYIAMPIPFIILVEFITFPGQQEAFYHNDTLYEFWYLDT